MDILIIIVFLAVFLLSGMFLSKPRGLPPGPIALPFVGSISMIRQFSKKRPHLVLYETAKKYGKIMSIQVGHRLIVVLTGYDVIHEALVNQADVFSDRPHSSFPSLKNAMKNGGGILYQRYNHHWEAMRRFTLQTLRDFGVGKSSIEEKIMTEVDAVAKVLKHSKGEALFIAPLMQNLAGNVIYQIIFGQRYDYEDPSFEMVKNFAKLIVSGQGTLSPINCFPIWLVKFVSWKTSEADLRREKMFKLVDNFLLEKIKEHEDTYDETNIRDFVDLYIQIAKGSNEHSKDTFTKGNMLRTIQDLFIAGSETSATTLDWVFLYMIEYPEVQRKCQKEIEEVVGDKPVEYADKVKLLFVDATLMEIQRLATIIPLSVPHSTTEDAELLGYKIPQGTMVFAMLYSISYDTKYWEEPEKFRPERFLDETGKVIIKRAAHIPFSTGPRVCLGEPLARMELFLVLANLLQRFTFHREDDSVKHSFESKITQVFNVPLEYKLKAIPRDSGRK